MDDNDKAGCALGVGASIGLFIFFVIMGFRMELPEMLQTQFDAGRSDLERVLPYISAALVALLVLYATSKVVRWMWRKWSATIKLSSGLLINSLAVWLWKHTARIWRRK